MTQLCECGCGEPAPICTKTEARCGHVKGQPLRFIYGHKKEFTHGLSESAEYRVYWGAQQRCQNPNNCQYVNYGGRGIKFLFSSFESFYNAVGSRPTSAHSLDRIDNDGNYEIGNVRWATAKEQRANQRVKKIEDFAIPNLVAEICRRCQGEIS